MKNFDLHSFPSEDDLTRAAAAEWLRDIESSKSSPYLVALSGGRVASRFFSAIADLAKPRAGFFKSVQFFWSDERCVPPTDAQSNFAAARELLLAPLGIPDSQIHRLRGENSPELAAKSAEIELRRFAPTAAEAQPIFDVVFLGLGEEGHVASLFPGEPDDMVRSSSVYRPVTATKPPPLRITLGYPAIAAARQVWVLASGAGKENALRDSLSPTGNTPLARVINSRPQTRIFTDIPTHGA